MSLKSKLKPFVPPFLWQMAARIAGSPLEFTGNYLSWEDALADADGYDSAEILRRVVASTRRVEAGEALFERDAVTFDHIEYSWPLLASLLAVAAETGSLRVLDFGGALGSTWRQNKVYLTRLGVPISWNVVEQAHFVAAGREEFSNQVLRFHSSIEDAAADGIDVLLFCSSLCYVADPMVVLGRAKATGARFLIIDRLPLVAGSRERIALQRVEEPIYSASYPVRMSRSRLFCPTYYLIGD